MWLCFTEKFRSTNDYYNTKVTCDSEILVLQKTGYMWIFGCCCYSGSELGHYGNADDNSSSIYFIAMA